MEELRYFLYQHLLIERQYSYNNNGEKKKFDVKPYLKFKPFKDLKDTEQFKKVKIAGLSIEWENGADICPDELYNNSK